ncbi:lipopolysaccharide transport periplasmic protein LptA [Succinimonas amylolytica]|uniref:lipopolysaccharide transport periplasmic protein LptA n=1 Tax=Succinimonas amylolytica TaxID=83769 RepID=UPI000475D477|nr:lipopolysaccharide transport periplasmic protein LptA [Succinimonas amylolytica]
MRFIPVLLTGSLVAFISSNAYSKQSDFKEPISVNSDRQIAELAENRVTFMDNVVITQGTIKIKADKVVVTRLPAGDVDKVTAYGNLASFDQIMDNGKPIHAEAKTISYTIKTQDITLSSHAFIQQENSKLSSDIISYNVKKEVMEAKSNESTGGRVTTVFIPDQLKKQIEATKKNK